MDYEPKTFEAFIGQDSIKRELSAMLVAQDKSNIIFRGNYGGGKTTLAKIYASYRGNYAYYDTPDNFNLNEGFYHEKDIKTIIVDEIHLADKYEYFYDAMGKYTFIFCTTERE